ncbi:uncharacterized protein LACBIDRAFT_191799 [Laccaria bicolor S238N-H82]|uniref:Predicted protein n=1 Tax=Laccaria bicolor (strain S238N-H82 / ATCC MYA-4686) TaxID=486041 RepID=B0DT79_LACBS|nr:uncharacterized protein LACBIDRAFT_191799 [Laccaria bicolor S238N-H82]EDR02173.1 predicted protein [Laccaria bicolor S238N-H82]|eukprot:XP_001887118.1 predicted protein [Laccaria bicolor S238N-H82]
MSIRILSATDVDDIVDSFTLSELQIIMARVFALISTPSSKIDAPARTSIRTTNHTALFMPARIAPSSSAGGTSIKIVCVPRAPDMQGLPATTLVLDESSGAVKAIVNARKLTALRNAAGSLLSTILVAQRMPRHLVVFGAGQQIEAHLDLFIRRFPSLRKCTIVNRTINARAQNLLQRVKERFPGVSVDLIASQGGYRDPSPPCIDIRNVISSAQLIICATSATTPLFPSSWVRSGTHVVLIGSYTPKMKEVDKELIARAIPEPQEPPAHAIESKNWRPILLVDSRKACASEAGELIDAGIKFDDVVEIGELDMFNEGPPELQDDHVALADVHGPITIFKSVGIGLQDVAIACAIVDKAEKMGGLNLGAGTVISNYDE